MEYIRDRLIREAVKYLEICQDYFFESKIEVDDYYSLTNVKFNFIENVLEEGNKQIFISNDLKKRLKKLFDTDSCIYAAKMSVAGK
jgi:hypothetical protein